VVWGQRWYLLKDGCFSAFSEFKYVVDTVAKYTIGSP